MFASLPSPTIIPGIYHPSILLNLQHVRAERHVVEPVGELEESRADEKTPNRRDQAVRSALLEVRGVVRTCADRAFNIA